MANVPIDPLLQPMKIGDLELKNRIVMSPIVRKVDPDGVPSEQLARYYRERAEGGVAAIYVGSMLIDHPGNEDAFGPGRGSAPDLHDEAARAGWKHVVDEVHAAGGLIFPQLLHIGAQKAVTHPDNTAYVPSPTWGPTDRATGNSPESVKTLSERPFHELSDSEVVEVIEAFALAARRSKEIGFDGIALHGAHGYLLDGFLSDDTNLRTDRWGGDHVGRTAFVVEVLKAIRREVGPGMPISFRFSQWRPCDYDGHLADTPKELEEILAPIVDAGCDIIEASTRFFTEQAFENEEGNFPYWTRKITGKPTVMCGGTAIHREKYDVATTPPKTINNTDEVMRRFENGEFDILAVGRALVNDPDWLVRASKVEDFLPFDGRKLNPAYIGE